MRILGSPKRSASTPYAFSGPLCYTAPGGVVCAHWLDCHCSHSSALPSAHVVPAKFSTKSSISKSGNGFCHLWLWEPSTCAVPTPLSVVIFDPLTWDTGSLVNKFPYTVAHTSTAGAGRWGEADNSAISPLARRPQNILLPQSLRGGPLTLALRACPRPGLHLLGVRRAQLPCPPRVPEQARVPSILKHNLLDPVSPFTHVPSFSIQAPFEKKPKLFYSVFVYLTYKNDTVYSV